MVDTIKKGLPFGTLLLYKDDGGVYQIIDGLQRSNAIIEFASNPTQFFEDEDIDISVLRKIVKLADMQGSISAQEEKIKDLLIEWVRNHKTLQEVEAMQFSKFGKTVSETFPTCQGKEFEIGDLIEPMMKNYQEICKKINDTKIPAIVMSGEADLLPVLFERINSKGTQLSKYQIFAATWTQKKYTISDELVDVVKANRDRYDQMFDGNGTIDEYDSVTFMNAMELNTFEIAFGLGKHLSNLWPHLFGKPEDEISVESIGFTLMASCLGMKNQQAKSMHTRLNELIGNDKINAFLKAIIDAVKVADKSVGKFSRFKSNSRAKAGERPLHSEFQIASVITSVFLLKYANVVVDQDDKVSSITYNFDQVNRSWKDNYRKKFESNVAKIFIIESLQKRWSGTGDKKLDMILITPDYYTKPVSEEDFDAALNVWFETLNDERSEFKKIASPKEQELIVLAAIYLSLFTAGQQVDASKYDIEHLAPQNLMKKHLDRFDGELRLPISSIGNLCLLPEYANRSKKDKTIYDDTEYLSKANITMKEIEEKYSFTEQGDLTWINDMTSSKEEFKEYYMTFIKNHFDRMKKVLKDNFEKI